jgi:GDPmannose 4,6-dehydratase/GDP-4-dehydro-6-deoxy-D-mannose reductase
LRKLKKSPLIIICSTSEVYGQVKKKDVPIKETQIFNPASPYAVSKAFQDLLSQVYYKCYGLKIIITRMFSYTNPRRTNLFQSSFAKQIVDIENNKKKFLVHGNLDSIRTVMDINDAMNAYWLVAKKGKIGEIYNIGGNYIISVKNFLKKLIKESKSKIKTKQSSNLIRKADVTLQIPNLKKFKKDTGWKQKTKPRDLIKNLMDYYRL